MCCDPNIRLFFAERVPNILGRTLGSDKRDKYWHIHMAVNTINGMTGERYFATYDDRNELKQYLEGIYPEWPWHHYPSESYYH